MNKVVLSNNLEQIESEITHHKQRAGESIWEIGRRLNHVKENDLAHGEFMEWYESIDLTKDFVSKSIKIAKELSNFEPSRNLGVEALYLIASLPEEEREKEHALVSGETKKAHEMTVRELQEVRRRNKQLEKEMAKANSSHESVEEIKERLRQQEIEAQRNKQELEQAKKELANATKPEVERVEVETHVDNTDYEGMEKFKRMAVEAKEKADNAERERLQVLEENRRLKEVERKRAIAEKENKEKEITKPHVSNNSGNNEWYTPEKYLDIARVVMGGIDTDPASSELANLNVQAETFFTQEDNGLEKDWHGNVWMNPPYAQPLIQQFSDKLVEQIEFDNVKQAMVLVNNATETKWFNTLSEKASAIWFPKGRIRFIDVEGNESGAPLQGQAILYFGENISEFKKQCDGLVCVTSYE